MKFGKETRQMTALIRAKATLEKYNMLLRKDLDKLSTTDKNKQTKELVVVNGKEEVKKFLERKIRLTTQVIENLLEKGVSDTVE